MFGNNHRPNDGTPVGHLYSRAVDEPTRYRCGACGNLTRFDVLSTRRSKRFVHFSLAGEPTTEEEEVLEERVESVTCRWCGSSEIEQIPRMAAE